MIALSLLIPKAGTKDIENWIKISLGQVTYTIIGSFDQGNWYPSSYFDFGETIYLENT